MTQIEINYAREAKRVNVKLLKSNIWQELTDGKVSKTGMYNIVYVVGIYAIMCSEGCEFCRWCWIALSNPFLLALSLIHALTHALLSQTIGR